MTDKEIMDLIKSEVGGLHGKLDTVIENQSQQKVETALVNQTLSGPFGIQKKLEEHEARLDCLEVLPKMKWAQRIPWIIGSAGIISSLVIGIINLLWKKP